MKTYIQGTLYRLLCIYVTVVNERNKAMNLKESKEVYMARFEERKKRGTVLSQK